MSQIVTIKVRPLTHRSFTDVSRYRQQDRVLKYAVEINISLLGILQAFGNNVHSKVLTVLHHFTCSESRILWWRHLRVSKKAVGLLPRTPTGKHAVRLVFRFARNPYRRWEGLLCET